MNTLLLDRQHPEQQLPTAVTTPQEPKHVTCSRSKGAAVGLSLFCTTVATVACVIFVSTVKPTSPAGPLASRPTVLLVGDSITQYGGTVDGWAAQLQSTYIRSVDVINRGLSGFNTRMFLENGIPVVSRELETSFAPVLITLWYGVNDAALADGPSANRHVPLDEYRVNLVKILNEFQRVAPQAKILVVSPPVVDDTMRRTLQLAAGGKSDPIDRTNAQAGRYALACGGVVQTLADDSDRVSFLDVHSYMMTAYENARSRAMLFSDGIHLSAEGNHVVFELVRSRVELLVGKALLETPQILDPKD